MTKAQAAYEAHVAAQPDPHRWKAWDALNEAQQNMWKPKPKRRAKKQAKK